MITKDNAAQYLPHLHTLAAGKTLQARRSDGTWKDLNNPVVFSEPPENYRAKPEPRIITVWEHSQCGRKLVEEGLPDTAGVTPEWTATVFRQVMEE